MGKTMARRPRAKGPGDAAAGPAPEPGHGGRGSTAEHTAEEGTWVDTYALHFPPSGTGKRTFDRGVGFEGYDRGTGAAVPKHPRLVRSGDAEAEADPFEAEVRGAAGPEGTPDPDGAPDDR